MARLLVTGGAGFIGTNFVHYWLREQPRDFILVLDALTYAGRLANLEPAMARTTFRFVHGNICDTPLVEALLRDHEIDVIVHLAAESHVDRSISGPDPFIEANIVGTHSMLKAARKVWLEEQHTGTHRFHHVSTDEVYGSLGPNDAAFTETTPYAPNSPYSASKAASDHLVRAYHHTYGLATTISNCSNNYGPYQFPEKLIPLMITRILAGEPLPVYGDGGNVRDWLHVEDHCRALELIIARGRVGEVYNVGGGAECANLALVRELCAVLDEKFAGSLSLRHRFPKSPPAQGNSSASLISFVTDRPGHDRRYAIDSSKLERELGFRPRHQFSDGLSATVDWYLAQRS
jgi:dTDP-glucose 4,6-dehydratase